MRFLCVRRLLPKKIRSQGATIRSMFSGEKHRLRITNKKQAAAIDCSRSPPHFFLLSSNAPCCFLMEVDTSSDNLATVLCAILLIPTKTLEICFCYMYKNMPLLTDQEIRYAAYFPPTAFSWRCSICLGLFALLCWDALFAPFVPAAAASAVAPARPQTDMRRTTYTSEQLSDARSRRPESLGPPGGGNETASGCRGEDKRRRASVAVDQAPPSLVGGDAQDRMVAVYGGSPVEDKLEASDAQTLREEEDSALEHDHAFPSPYQSEPADLMTVAFAGRRRHLLEGVFASVEQGRGGALVRRTWLRHYGKACTGERSSRE